MKKLIKKLIERYGYVVMTAKRLKTIEEGTFIPKLDFHYLIKKVIDKEEAICFFDIGANTGQTSKKINQYFPNASIYAFEPVKKTFDQLVFNTQTITKVHAFQNAMGAEPGEFVIYHRPDSEWNSLVKELNDLAKNEGAVSETVQVNTVDLFLKEKQLGKIDILKSDTEGFELQVLEGAKEALQEQLIDMLYIEVGFVKGDQQHTHWMDVVNHLEQYGYSFCGLFESSYGFDLKPYYGNALFMSPSRLEANKKKEFIVW